MPRTGENIHKRADGRWEGRFIKGKVGDKYIRCSVYGKTYKETKKKLAIAKTEYYSDIDDMDLREYQEFLEWKAFREEYHEFMAWKAVKAKVEADSGAGIAAPYEQSAAPKRNRRAGLLSDSDRAKLEEYLFTNTTVLKLGVLLCLYVGLRIGELSALKWGDINLDRKNIHVALTVQRVKDESGNRKTRLDVVEPKFRSAIRDVAIPEKICAVIPELKTDDSHFVLTGTDRFMDPRTMENWFDRMMEECGINGITIEACRRAYKAGS